MIIGVLSDAHGNIFGLKQCYQELKKRNVNQTYFLGDALDYFSRGKEVLDFLKEEKIECIKGNHEDILFKKESITNIQKAVYNFELTERSLSVLDYKYIHSWKKYKKLNIDGLRILMVHGSPFGYQHEYIYPDSDFARFSDLEYDIIFMGHTHIPFTMEKYHKWIVNVGSVGYSRIDGRYLNYAILDTKKKDVQICQINFPMDKIKYLRPYHKKIDEILKRRDKTNL